MGKDVDRQERSCPAGSEYCNSHSGKPSGNIQQNCDVYMFSMTQKSQSLHIFPKNTCTDQCGDIYRETHLRTFYGTENTGILDVHHQRTSQ